MLHLGMKSSTYSYNSPLPGSRALPPAAARQGGAARLPGRGRRNADITGGARLGGAWPAPLPFSVPAGGTAEPGKA